ncbi:hypothetical protein LTR84_009719 [Exophiala bonariae]|uniref:Xylanolytic transcriptional activator regulatory domain-containing protein n=1 Tax=Exophiala bonariae TaxID=1690606 RepID=A0AAV9NMT4_9EURO|nr:hypothetical protein LTR84_009719 [Exophiala bonariae]
MSKTPPHSGSFLADIPNYIKPFPPSLEVEDLDYLQKKGVFALPDSDVQDACLRSYFKHIHPIYPVIDPVTVTPMLKDGNKKKEKMSLLLIYAIIFVGSTWIDIKLLRKLGFLSRRVFRKSIHKKMRLLYDADYETDRLCLIQVFILWTFWFEGPNENKDGWHWIGVALSLSRVIGLHQASLDAAGTKSSINRFRRRLWWCLATRDVICSFALSRCPRITDISHNVSMIGIEDFDFNPMPAIIQMSNSQSLCQQQTLARICVHYFKLVSIFGKICKAAYPESGSGKSSVLYSSEQLEGMDSIGGDRNLSVANQLKMFQAQLDQWRREVPDDLWHDSNLLSNLDGAERVEQVHRGLLSMMYYATVMILHRPQMGAMNTTGHSVNITQSTVPDPPRVLVRFAAMQMTQIAMDFYQEDLVESLAATCISCLILASISHIFDIMSVEQVVQSEARKKLEQCRAIFHAFADQQAGGLWGLGVIDYIMFRLKHQQFHRKIDVTPFQGNSNSLSLERSNEASISDDVNAQDQLHTNHILATTDSSRKQDTEGFSNGSSSTSHIPVFPSPRQPFGFNESFLPGLSLDQPLPDNLMSFLGPDIAWLEFPNPCETLDVMSWSGTGGG